MIYYFGDIPNGQLREGSTVVTILNGEAEVTTDEEKALAEKYGGVEVKPKFDPMGTKPLFPPENGPEEEGDKWQ